MSMSSSLSGSKGLNRGATGSNIPTQNIAGRKVGQISTMSPETLQLYRKLLGGVQGGVGQGLDWLGGLASGNSSSFDALEGPSQNAFNKYQGQLASQYSGLGAQNSSAFFNQSSQGASDFAQQLGLQRINLQHQALKDLLGLSQSLIGTPTHENFMIEPEQKRSKLAQFLGIGAPIAGAALGGIFGGIPGAALGGSIGSSFAGGFE